MNKVVFDRFFAPIIAYFLGLVTLSRWAGPLGQRFTPNSTPTTGSFSPIKLRRKVRVKILIPRANGRLVFSYALNTCQTEKTTKIRSVAEYIPGQNRFLYLFFSSKHGSSGSGHRCNVWYRTRDYTRTCDCRLSTLGRLSNPFFGRENAQGNSQDASRVHYYIQVSLYGVGYSE